MDPDKYKELQSNLNKEEIRLRSLRANIHHSWLAELESANETLQYWQNQFQGASVATKGNVGGLKLLEKTKPIIKIAGFEDIESIDARHH